MKFLTPKLGGVVVEGNVVDLRESSILEISSNKDSRRSETDGVDSVLGAVVKVEGRLGGDRVPLCAIPKGQSVHIHHREASSLEDPSYQYLLVRIIGRGGVFDGIYSGLESS